jgi:cell division protein FtsB
LTSQRKNFWKISLIAFLILVSLSLWLGFGKYGLIHLYRTEMERQEYVDRINRLAEENRALLEEINRFRSDMEYVEYVARKELNMIKENEMVFRFQKEGTKRSESAPPGTHADTSKETGEAARR